MIKCTRLLAPVNDLPKLLKGWFAAMGMIILLSGFTVTSIEFNSEGVPPSKFKINLAKQKGLPVPTATPGLPVKATLTKPSGEGPFPAVVLFSTEGGWRDTPQHWRKHLNDWGYVTLEVGTETDGPKAWEPTTRVLDAIGALKYLREVTYVDINQVVVMGWSLGANTALWAIDTSSWAANYEHRFVAAVAIYPSCESVGEFFSPALIISAELDDIASPSGCERLVSSTPPGSQVPKLEIIPGAFHWFDLPHKPAQSYGMSYEYNAKATEAAIEHVRSFLEANY